MKTPTQWRDEILALPAGIPTILETIEAIQKDALRCANSPEDLVEQAEMNMIHYCERMEHYKSKWHEARRHLRAANKGAERSAKALELSVTRYWDLVNSDKRYKERDMNQHKTIVWNWLLLSDEDLRLKCGELSSQDIRNIRAVLRAMLGSSVRLKHNL